MNYCPQCGQSLTPKSIDEKRRLVCPDAGCGFVFWDNPVPVVAAIAEVPEGVVLAHNVAWPPGVLSIITGFLEQAESPEQAVVREVKEELGLVADTVDFVGLYPFAQMNQLIIAYHVAARGRIRLNEELDEYKLIPKEKLKGWGFGTGLAVADWLASSG